MRRRPFDSSSTVASSRRRPPPSRLSWFFHQSMVRILNLRPKLLFFIAFSSGARSAQRHANPSQSKTHVVGIHPTLAA